LSGTGFIGLKEIQDKQPVQDLDGKDKGMYRIIGLLFR